MSEVIKVDAPRGAYYVYQVGSEIFGTVDPANITARVVNARAIHNFTSDGFVTLDEVIEYVKKYF